MDGILVINKPAGMTSHDVINVLRRRFNQKKFGHTGTLDPQASGVLVVAAGNACKALQFIEDTDKEYIASMQLGTRYDTDDIFGNPLESREVNRDFDFQKMLDSFTGNLHQRVPDASAKKVNGKKLYEYLRAGQPVPEVYSDVTVYEAKALDHEKLEFKLSCSSGTFVRSICRDLALATGNFGAMSSLVRTRANGFSLEEADDLDAENIRIYPLERALQLPKVQAPNVTDIKNGKPVKLDTQFDRVLLCDGDSLLAVYDRKEKNKDMFLCKRGLWS
jgi:tRNA pseudouridine55 synthase